MMKEQLLKKQRNHALIAPGAGLVMKKLEAFSLSSYDLAIQLYTHKIHTRYTSNNCSVSIRFTSL
jgi:hypothetical protein